MAVKTLYGRACVFTTPRHIAQILAGTLTPVFVSDDADEAAVRACQDDIKNRSGQASDLLTKTINKPTTHQFNI